MFCYSDYTGSQFSVIQVMGSSVMFSFIQVMGPMSRKLVRLSVVQGLVSVSRKVVRFLVLDVVIVIVSFRTMLVRFWSRRCYLLLTVKLNMFWSGICYLLLIGVLQATRMDA
jgi:hypothetical protein